MTKHVKKRKLTTEEQRIAQALENVADMADRSDKTAWNRKLRNIETLVKQIQNIEKEIYDLTIKKQPLADEISRYRLDMVDTCIHPLEQLVYHNGVVKCKFCERTIRILNDSTDKN